ncbi:hypothetical protein Tco_1462255, partial [Tanacetum coccineum]
IADFEERLERIYSREIHRVQVVGFQRMPELMRDGLFGRMVMEHRDDAGVVVFTSQAWGRLFDTRGPLVWELILEFLSTLRFGEDDGTQYCWEEQAPKKVTVTDFFYLRGLDVGSVNIPYLLARYLGRFAARRKSEAHISGGQFMAHLAEHFGLLTMEILVGLIVSVPELPIIGLERQPNAAAGAPRVAQDAPIVNKGGQADPAPTHAPPPPPATARTMPQRMARLEEDVHEIHGMLAEQHEVISVMACDFSRFCTWTTTSLAWMMDRAGVTYTSYSETPREYTRPVRRRTGEASTSAAQQDQQQPDP